MHNDRIAAVTVMGRKKSNMMWGKKKKEESDKGSGYVGSFWKGNWLQILLSRIGCGPTYVTYQKFQNFLQQKGIISKITWPYSYTPQQNGVEERKNCLLLDVVESLPLASSVPSTFLVEAISTVVYLFNCLPSPNLKHRSPYCSLHGKHFQYTHLIPLVLFVLSVYFHQNVMNFLLVR